MTVGGEQQPPRATRRARSPTWTHPRAAVLASAEHPPFGPLPIVHRPTALGSARAAPAGAAILLGSLAGTIGDDVRDATGRVPILWFQDTDEHETPRQRFHVDVWVPPEVAEQRIAAAVAAGGIVVDDRQAPSYSVIADQDGNKACVCTTLPPAKEQ